MASITRKQFLVGIGATAGATMLRPPDSRAARRTVIKYANDTPIGDPRTDHAIAAAEQIKKETNGEVEVQVFPDNQLGNDTHMLSEVRSGAIQMMGIGDVLLSVLVPSCSIDNIGFAFKDAKTAFAALDGAVGDIVRSDVEKHQLHPMSVIWDEGFREITTSTKPIETPEDLKGFKIRVPESPSILSVFKNLGAAPVTMNVDELYTALQTHVVNGQENPLIVIETVKLYEVQEYCSLTNHMWGGEWIVANAPFWQRLPVDHQKIIAAAFDAQGIKERLSMVALNSSLQERLIAQGLKFNKTDPALFRAKLVESGYYTYWEKKLGSKLWSSLEKHTGTLA